MTSTARARQSVGGRGAKFSKKQAKEAAKAVAARPLQAVSDAVETPPGTLEGGDATSVAALHPVELVELELGVAAAEEAGPVEAGPVEAGPVEVEIASVEALASKAGVLEAGLVGLGLVDSVVVEVESVKAPAAEAESILVELTVVDGVVAEAAQATNEVVVEATPISRDCVEAASPALVEAEAPSLEPGTGSAGSDAVGVETSPVEVVPVEAVEAELPAGPVNYDEPGLFEVELEQGLYRFDAGKQGTALCLSIRSSGSWRWGYLGELRWDGRDLRSKALERKLLQTLSVELRRFSQESAQ